MTEAKPADDEIAKLRHACSYCGVAPGEWCMVRNAGWKSEFLHAVRGKTAEYRGADAD